jgi:sialic acid synthase SpsE
MPEVLIQGRPVGPPNPPLIIAEAGINHNGELSKALEMVRVAKRAGADVIKFQTFQASEFIADPAQTYTYRSQGRDVTESMLEMFRRYELPRQAWFEIKAECERQGILFMSTPQNRSDLDLLLEVGVPAIKVGSDDFTNTPLLKDYATTGLPLVLSCGMADLAEVYRSLDAVGALEGYPTILLLCTSQYPTPAADVNLRKITTLKTAFPMIPIGFSDHTEGPLASSLAVALGATVFEKHFTLDRDLPGPDHWFSEDPRSLAEWKKSIRTGYIMLGSAVVQPTAAEVEMRKIARRSIVPTRDIASGEVLTYANIALRRPGTGFPPDMLDYLIGMRASRNLKSGTVLTLQDVVR